MMTFDTVLFCRKFVGFGLLVVTSAVRTSVDIGASAKLELMDKFCYLGDMLSVDGDADAALEARIRIGWNTIRYDMRCYFDVCSKANMSQA